MEQLSNALQKFGIGRLAMILAVGVGVVAALIALTMTLGQEPQALLYSNMDLKEAASVTQALDQANIKYQVKGDGSTIMVARDKVAATRLLVSGKGLVTQGSVGYEIFDNTNALGQTDFVQKLNQQRALEGELGRTIREWDGVQSVRVHLALPKRQLFEEEAEQASATVSLGVGGRDPSPDMVRAVQNLVAGAVLGMKVERVTVVDQHGKTLSGESGDGGLDGKAADDRKTEVEAKIAKQVKDLVEGVVGPGHAQVKVTAALDLNRVTTQEEKYDPDGQVVRSESTSAENASENKSDSTGGVTAAANIPGGSNTAGFQPTGSTSGQNESVTNYEISKSVRTEVTEPGTVKKLSVAVAVDGVTAVDAKGKPGAYTPRSAQEMQQIQDLVRAAVGYDQSRGDQVTVVNVKFPRDADTDGVTAASPLMGFDKNDIMRIAELGIAAIVALLIMLFLVRPLMKNAMGGAGAGGGQLMIAGGTQGVPSQMVSLAGGAGGDMAALAGPEMDSRINIAKIEGQVKASSIKQVSDFAEKHPEESVSILRSWLHESA